MPCLFIQLLIADGDEVVKRNRRIERQAGKSLDQSLRFGQLQAGFCLLQFVEGSAQAAKLPAIALRMQVFSDKDERKWKAANGMHQGACLVRFMLDKIWYHAC